MANREITSRKQLLEQQFAKHKLIHDLGISVLVGLFIGFLAPFGMQQLPLVYSMSYWVIACICGYLIYKPVIIVGELLLIERITTPWIRIGLSTLVASAIMSLFIPWLTWLFFKQPIALFQQFWVVFPKAVVIGSVITFAAFIKERLKSQQQLLANTEKKVGELQQQNEQIEDKSFNKFMAQLPVEKRGRLYCLQMDDHYLKVYTDQGHHLILMRFKDALEMLENYPGLQTHRSWWVSIDAVEKVEKDGRKTLLKLTNDISVPVSKTYADKVKQANLH